jgi:hypothetical protein
LRSACLTQGREQQKVPRILDNNLTSVPGDPVNGVAELVGVSDLGEEANIAAAAAAAVADDIPGIPGGGVGAKGGGDSGLGGPPLDGFGGLMRFSFWRLEREVA